MDKFLALTEEKRLTILNAALQCFGKFGYEKASINDIAVAAHISKASVFQYFGSKKQLYIYLLEYCKKIIEGLFDKEALDSETDLFDRILASSRMKMEGLQNQPFILQFITSAWEENSPEVTDTLAILTEETGRIPKRSCSAGRGCFEIQRPRGCPAGLSDAASDGRGLCGRVPGGGGFRFSGCHGGFERTSQFCGKIFIRRSI